MRRRALLSATAAALTVPLVSGCSRDGGGGDGEDGSGDGDGGGNGGGGGPYGMVGADGNDMTAGGGGFRSADGRSAGPVPGPEPGMGPGGA